MSVTPQSARVVMLVKALPQRSTKHGETVCCAGITADGEWKRLFPVRFRHLKNDSSFKRWDWVEFEYRPPVADRRVESCKVAEESIAVKGVLAAAQRASFLNPLVLPSISAAIEQGRSLALIRPKDVRFFHKRKTESQLSEERAVYKAAAAQSSLFDAELAALEPTPFDFKFRFRDEQAAHEFTNGDWEAHAMFYNRRRAGKSEDEVLAQMQRTFGEDYPRRGMLFAVGNQAKRPQTWQLLGVLRVDEEQQLGLRL